MEKRSLCYLCLKKVIRAYLSTIVDCIILNNVILLYICNISSPSRHGFLSNRSTSSQLLKYMYDWCSAVELGHFTMLYTLILRKRSTLFLMCS